MSKLRIEYVPLSSIVLWEGNPKAHNIELLEKSLEKFGYTQPLLVDEQSGALVAGHGRVEVLRSLRAAGRPAPDHVEDVGDDWLVPVIRGVVFDSRSDASTYIITDNNTTITGGWDDVALAALIHDLEKDDVDIRLILGFSQQEMNKVFESLVGAPTVEKVANAAALDDAPLFSDGAIIEKAVEYFSGKDFESVMPWCPVHVGMQEINKLAAITDYDQLRNSHIANKVADYFQRHRFSVHCDSKKFSVADITRREKQLRELLTFIVTNNGCALTQYLPATSFGLVHGSPLAVNFRPGYATFIYRKYCQPGSTVLDTSNGFGGRLVGAIASKVVKKYIGIDPSEKTYYGNCRMLVEYGRTDFAKLIMLPVEDVDAKEHDIVSSADFAFTSPPYFAKEKYADESTQSCIRYPTPEKWRDGFLLPMFKLQYKVLKEGTFSIVNIDDVIIPGFGKEPIPLVKWARSCAELAGFTYQGVEVSMPVSLRPGVNTMSSSESFLIFKKG